MNYRLLIRLIAAILLAQVYPYLMNKFISDGVDLSFVDGSIGDFTERMTYCMAHKKCLDEGDLSGLLGLLIGADAEVLPQEALRTLPIWSRVNALLSPVENQWTKSDPGRSTEDCAVQNFLWKNTRVPTDSPQVTIYDGYGLVAVNQTGTKYAFVCRFIRAAYPTRITYSLTVEPYVKNWPQNLGELINSNKDSTGCFEEKQASTLIDCGMKCQSMKACRALFYHEGTARCMLSLYVDALLPYDTKPPQRGWQRFGRKLWGTR